MGQVMVAVVGTIHYAVVRRF